MPIFNQYGPLTIQVSPGSTTPLFTTADTLANGTISRVITPLDSGPVGRKGIMFEAVGVGATIFGSNVSPTAAGPQGGVQLGVVAAGSAYQDTTSFAYYWAVASGAGTGSVTAHVS